MRPYFSWLFLSIIACCIAVVAAFAFGASGMLVARTILTLGSVDPRAAIAALVVGALGTVGTPTSAGLWMVAAVRSLVQERA
jgi:hypothetical protein